MFDVQSFVAKLGFSRPQRPKALDALLALESKPLLITNSSAFYEYGYSRKLCSHAIEVGNDRIGIVYVREQRPDGKPPHEILEITFEMENRRKWGSLYAEFVRGQLKRIRRNRRGRVMDFDESSSVPLRAILAATREAIKSCA